MMRSNRFAKVLLGVSLAALPAMAQEAGRSEVSVQAFGSWVKSTTQNGVQQGATNSGGVLANDRFFFTNNHGVEINYGYSLNTQNYGLSLGNLGVKANQHEVTAAYVYRHPLKHFTPFAEAGVGGLIFSPTELAGANTQPLAALVDGAGAHFNITQRLFMRAQYRGLVYNSPTFDLLQAVTYDRVTHRAEPSIGFGYRF